MSSTKWQRYGGAAGLVASGLIAGGVLVGTLSANAATETTAGSGTATTSTGQTAVAPSQPQRSDEKLLTGTTKASVEKAVLAKYPGATIERTETNSGGVYESHIRTASGTPLIVEVGADFAVTGTDNGGPGGR